MPAPGIAYARSGDLNIAYQGVGNGPPDLVFVPGIMTNIELAWDEEHWAGFLEGLASFSRLILFDRRGVGLSDRVTGVPTLEERTDDVRAVLDAVGSEHAVLFGAGDAGAMFALFAAMQALFVPPKLAAYVADHIPGAEYVEVPGVDSLPWVGDTTPVLDAIERFVADVQQERMWEDAEPDRVLTTVLLTDIVASTAKAAALGDQAWRELLTRHHTAVRRQLARFRGVEIDTAGDGCFATFDAPARAIRCARAIVDAGSDLGVEIRAGLHTGECERIEGKVGGIAVHLGSRIAALARPGEVLVSSR